MTLVLEELIVDLGRDVREGRRTYLLCFGEEVTDVAVDLAVMNMAGRESAPIEDLQDLKAHVERYGLLLFPVVCRGSWTTLQGCIHYPCLTTDASGERAVIEPVAGINYWPANTRFLLVDKSA